MLYHLQQRKTLETAKCDAEDTGALAVSLNTSSNSELSPQTNTLSTTAGVMCAIALCLTPQTLITRPAINVSTERLN